MCHTEETGFPRIAILGSGRGTNARAILEAVRDGKLAAEVALIISDKPEAGILDVAREYEVDSMVLGIGGGKPWRLSDKAAGELSDLLGNADVELVVLAGFMRIIREPLLTQFAGRILNIHPSLLPKFPGLNTVQRAIEAGENETGCTIHLVDSGIDTGRILHQERVLIEAGDTLESLTAKIHEAEHRTYPRVIQQIVEGL